MYQEVICLQGLQRANGIFGKKGRRQRALIVSPKSSGTIFRTFGEVVVPAALYGLWWSQVHILGLPLVLTPHVHQPPSPVHGTCSNSQDPSLPTPLSYSALGQATFSWAQTKLWPPSLQSVLTQPPESCFNKPTMLFCCSTPSHISPSIIRGQKTLSVKIQIVNILGIAVQGQH